MPLMAGGPPPPPPDDDAGTVSGPAGEAIQLFSLSLEENSDVGGGCVMKM